MRLKKDYEYVVRDVTNNILGVFETEGLAHQFIQRMGQTPKKSKWALRGMSMLCLARCWFRKSKNDKEV